MAFENPLPWNFQYSSMGKVWIFPGTTHAMLHVHERVSHAVPGLSTELKQVMFSVVTATWWPIKTGERTSFSLLKI